MKLSFIIPAFNEEQYLGKCLSSVLAEIARHTNLEAEVIVVNNASTDRTVEIALSFPNVKVVEENNKGLVFARQAGAAAATGDILAHVDADCVLPEGWIKTAVEEFSRSENLVALSGPYIVYDLSKFKNFQIRLFYRLAYVTYLLNRFVLKNNSMLQGGNILVRRRAWEKMGQPSKGFEFYGEDAELARRLNKIGKVKFTFKLPMQTSGRRLVKEGVWTMAFRYSMNYFFVTFLNKPFTKKYKDIRINP